MKKKVSTTKNTIVNRSVRILAGSIAAFFAAQSASASTIVWSGATDNVFATGTNWVGGIAPVSGDIAQFVDAGGAVDTISLGGGATLNTLQFDAASAAAYTIGSGAVGSQTLTLNAGGAITMSSTVAANELVNANVVLGTDATTQAYTFTNDSTTNSLTFAGNVSGGTGGVAGTETLTVNGAGATSISGVIGNGGATAVALTKAGTGTLAVSGSNTYTGVTTINGGTLAANSAAALGVGGNISFTGGTLKYSAASATQDWGARIKSSSSAIKLDLNAQNVTLAGVMDSSNNAGLNVTGPGRLVLSGANGFTGNVTVSGGTLSISSDGTGATNQLGAYPGSVTAANITLNNGANLEFSAAATIAVNRGITLGSGYQFLSKTAGVSPTINSVIAGSGGLILMDTRANNVGGGSGVNLSAANTYSGVTTIAHGDRGNQNGTRWYLQNKDVFQNTTLDYVNILGLNSTAGTGTNAERVVFKIASTTNFYTFGGLKGSKALMLSDDNGAMKVSLKVGNNNQNTIYTGILNDNTKVSLFEKIGTGVLQLGAVNTYTGGTTVSNGTLMQTVGGASLGTNGALTVGSSGTFAYEPTAAAALTLGSGVLTLNGGATITGAVGGTASQSVISSSGTAVTSGTVTVNVTGIPGVTVTNGVNNLFTATTGLAGATYTLGKIYNATNFTVGALSTSATAVGINVTSATALTSEVWKGGNAGGGNSVWAQSDGSANSNWTTDGTTVTNLTPGSTADISFVSTNSASNQGAMTLGANMTVKSVTVSDTVTWSLNDDGNLLTVTPAASTTGITINSGAGAVTFNPQVKLGAAQTWTNNSSNLLTFSNDILSGNNNLIIDGSGNTTISGGIRDGTASVTKNGAGTLILSGTNLFQGGLTVNAGTVQAGSTFALGAAMFNVGSTYAGNGFANLTFGASSTGTVQLNGNNITLTRLSTNATPGTPIVENASATPVLLTVTESTNTIASGAAGAAATDTYAGNLRDGTGGGALSLQTTVGSLTLSGATSYTGQTLVQGGTLIFGKRNSNYANWTPVNMNVASGATLGLGVGDNSSGYFDTTDLDTLLNSSHLGASTTTSGLKTGSILGFDTTNATSGAFTYNTAITQLGGMAQVAKLGTGTLTLGGSSSYTAATNVIGGTLSVASLANGGTNSNIGASSSAAANLLLGNGTTFQYTGGVVSTDRLFTVNGTGAAHAASLDASGTSGAITFSNTLPILWGTAAQTRTFTLTGGNNNDNTFTPLITDNTSGVVTFNKTGGGTWVLNSAEAFTGTTTVNGGTLKLGVNNALQLNKVLTLTSGTLDLGSNSQYAGNFTGAGGTLTGTGGTFTTNAANGTFAGQVTGSLGFIKAGANTLILTADNTTTGAVKVIGGGLTLKDSGKLSGTTAITINGGTLSIDNTGTSNLTDRVKDSTGSPTITMNSGTLSFIGTSSAATETLGDVTVSTGFNSISVPAAAAAATLTLTSLARTSGALINVGNSLSLGQGGASPALIVTGGLSGNLAVINGVVPGVYNFQGADAEGFVGYDSVKGFGVLGQAGFGSAPAGGSSSSGSTDNVSGGWALAGSQAVNSLKNAGTFTFAGATDTLTLTSGMILNTSQAGSTFGTTGTRGQLTSSTSELFIIRYNGNGSPSNQVFNSKITGSGVKLIIAGNNVGDGRYDPVFTAQNDYTGGTVISGVRAKLIGTNVGDVVIPAGGITINDGGTLAEIVNGGQINSSNAVTINGGGTLQLSGTNTLAGFTFNSNGGTVAPTVSIFNQVTGASGVAIGTSGTGTLILGGNISSTPTNVAVVPVIGPASSLLDLNNTARTITVAANPSYAAQTGLTIQSNIQSGTTALPGSTPSQGSVTKEGAGVLELSGANTFSGGITINAGAVLASSAQSIGGLYNMVTLNNNSGLWLNAATVGSLGSNVLSVSATNGTLASVGGDRTLSANVSLTGALNVSLADPTLNSTDRAITINSVISGSGSIVVSGATSNTVTAKALVLSSNGGNFFTGGLTINSGGRVQTTTTNALGAPSNALTVNTNGVFDMVNTRQIISNLTGTGGQIISSNATGGTLLVGYGNGTGGNFAGILATGTGQIALTKLGSGTLTLSGNNTTTGATTILGGTLVLSGSPTGNSAITIQGGTLQLDYSTNNTSKINDSAVLTLAGGTLDLKGGSSNTEIVGSTSLAGGLNNITRSVTGSVLRMGAINTTTAAGIVDFGAASIASTTNANDASGILGPWATLNNTWAVNSGTLEGNGNNYITAYSGAFADLAAQGATITDGSTTHARINSAGALGNVALSAATTTVSTLLQNSTTVSTIETASKTLKTNGIMMGSGKGAVTIGATAGDGALQTATASTNLVLNNKSSNLLTINAPITNNGTTGLTVNGNVTLKGANTFTGPTGISGGTLEIASGSLNGGTYAGAISLGGGSTLKYNSSTNQTLSGVISGVGGITKDNGSTLTLSNTSNSFFGPIVVNNGTLTGSGANAFGTNAIGNALTIANLPTAAVTTGNVNMSLGSLAGGGLLGGNLTLGGSTLTVGTDNTNTTYGGTISGNANITKAGLGTLTLTNNVSTNATVTLNGGGGLTFSGSTAKLPSSPNFTMGSTGGANTLTITGGAALTTFTTYVSGAGGNPNNGQTNNTVNITGAGSIWKLTNTTDIFDRGTGGNFNISNGGTFDSTNGQIYFFYFTNAANNTVTVDGAGSVWNSANLDLANSGSYNTLTISNGGYLNTSGGATLGQRIFTSGGSTGGLYNTVAVTGIGSVWSLNASGLTLGDGSLASDGNRVNVYNGGFLSGVTTLLLQGPSSSINESVNIGDGNALASLSANTVTLNFAGARLNFNNGRFIANATGNMVSGTGQISLNGPAIFSTNQAASTIAVGTVINGTGSLTKQDTGTLTLSAPNTYTGATIVNGGTLVADTVTNATVLSSSSGLQLGGGTFQLKGLSGQARSQTLAGLTVNAGSSVVDANNVAGGTSTTIDLSGVGGTTGITRSAGGTVDFKATTGTFGTTAVVKTAQANNASGILGAWATVNGGADFAANNGSNVIVAYTGYGSLDAQAGGANGTVLDNTNANLRIDATGTSGSVPIAGAVTNINTLMQNFGTASTIDTSAGILRTGTNGGILITPSGQSLTIGTTANSGTLTGGGNTDGVAGDLLLSNASANTLTVNSVIANNAGGVVTLTKAGSGNVVLNGTNTYTGTTFLNAGTLTYGASDAIASGSVTVNGGTLAMSAFNDTVGAVTLKAGSITGSGTLTSTSGFTFDNVSAASASTPLAGSVGLTKSNLGTMTLSGASTYTGTTTISEGKLAAGVASVANTSGAFGNNSAVTISAAPSASIDITGFNTQIGSLAGGGASGGGVILGAATLTTGDNNTSTAYAGVISGTGAIVKNGTGTWTISGASSYSGTTTINAGTLKLGGVGNGTNSPLGTTGAGTTVAATGAALDLNGLALSTAEALALNGTGVSSGGALTNSAAGPAVFGGLISLGSDSSIVANNGAVILTNAGTIAGSGFALTLGGNAASTQVSSLASIIGTGAGAVTKTGSGTWLLSGVNTFTGQLTVENGTLATATVNNVSTTGVLGNNALSVILGKTGGLTGTLEFTNATSATSTKPFTMATGGTGAFQIDGTSTTLTLQGLIDGGGGLTKTGAGTLKLNGATGVANTYSGLTTVSAGTLNLDKQVSGSLNQIAGNITISSGATLSESSFSNQIDDASAVTVAGTYSLSSSSSETIGTLTVNGGTVTTSSSNLELATTGTQLTMTGGTITLGNTVAGAGSLRLNGNVSIASSSTSALIQASNLSTQTTSTLDLRGGTRTFDVATGTGAALGAELIVSTIIADGTGTGNISKSGNGTMVLNSTSASTYVGSTGVSAGTLLVTGSLSGTTAVSVSGGTLEITAANRINDAATVTMSAGTFKTDGFSETVGAFTLSGTATIDLGAGASILQLANSSANTWSGGLSITNWSGLEAGGGTDQIFFGTDATGLTAGQIALVSFVNPAGFDPGTYGATQLSTGELVVVPEPGAAVSLLGGLGLLLGVRRRRA